MSWFKGWLERRIEGSLNLMMRGLKLLQDAFGPEYDDKPNAARIDAAVAAVGSNPGMMFGGASPMLVLPVLGDEPVDPEPTPVSQGTFPRLYVPEPGEDAADEPQRPAAEWPLRIFRPDADCA